MAFHSRDSMRRHNLGSVWTCWCQGAMKQVIWSLQTGLLHQATKQMERKGLRKVSATEEKLDELKHQRVRWLLHNVSLYVTFAERYQYLACNARKLERHLIVDNRKLTFIISQPSLSWAI